MTDPTNRLEERVEKQLAKIDAKLDTLLAESREMSQRVTLLEAFKTYSEPRFEKLEAALKEVDKSAEKSKWSWDVLVAVGSMILSNGLLFLLKLLGGG